MAHRLGAHIGAVTLMGCLLAACSVGSYANTCPARSWSFDELRTHLADPRPATSYEVAALDTCYDGSTTVIMAMTGDMSLVRILSAESPRRDAETLRADGYGRMLSSSLVALLVEGSR
jgi:hypothetical protein